jgi:hypothetical protein
MPSQSQYTTPPHAIPEKGQVYKIPAAPKAGITIERGQPLQMAAPVKKAILNLCLFKSQERIILSYGKPRK